MKEKIQYLYDTLIDYEGKERKFILCAYTIPKDGGKITTFGLSLTRPEDMPNYNKKLGESKALWKAKGSPFATVTCDMEGGMNTNICNSYLKSFAKYFKEDPSSLLPWYKHPDVIRKEREEEKERKRKEKEFKEECIRRGIQFESIPTQWIGVHQAACSVRGTTTCSFQG